MEAPNKGLLFAFMDKKKVKALPAPDEPKRKKKNSEEVIDVSAKKKKKRLEDSHAVALLEEPKLSKLKGKALRTQFGQGAEKILRLLEQDDTDPAIALIYKRLLQSVVDVLPLAEMGIRNTKGIRGVHGFNMLISSLRELMVDVQAAQDRGMMGDMLVQSVLQPAFSDLAQDTVLEYSTLAADLKMLIPQDEHAKLLEIIKESRSRLANRMTSHYRTMKDGTIGYLQR